MSRLLMLAFVWCLASCQDAQDEGRRDSRDATELGDTQALVRPVPADTPNSQRLNQFRDSMQQKDSMINP